MINRTLQCFAVGHPGHVQAICIDLDIAVEATSLEEAQSRMRDAIAGYVEDAMRESPDVRTSLLSRRAPLRVRLKMALGYFLHAVRNRPGKADDMRAGFDIACPA